MHESTVYDLHQDDTAVDWAESASSDRPDNAGARHIVDEEPTEGRRAELQLLIVFCCVILYAASCKRIAYTVASRLKVL